MDESSAVLPSDTALGDIPLEQQFFERSPFGTFTTAAIVFLLLFGSFLAVGVLQGVPMFDSAEYPLVISPVAWSALALSLSCCAALAMQRYARKWEALDFASYANILTGGLASASIVTSIAVRGARLGRATLLGIVIGLLISILVRYTEIREGHLLHWGAMVWFAISSTLLSVLFARGVEQSRAGSKAYGEILKAELKIDLLRIDKLAVLGRSAARVALIWFVVSAVACLFFVSGDLNWLTIGLIVSCAAMGIGMFAGNMLRIHRQIIAAKNVELERIRRQIDPLREKMHDEPGAATRLPGLLAYEKRIADAHEWPFDQSTLVRLGASAFILVVPWIGRAAAEYLIDHFGRIVG
jgi:flagellar biosynthesis protein FliQ